MAGPRTFYGWEVDGKFKVSLFPRASGKAANTYESKEDAEQQAVKYRTDRGKPGPSIMWEDVNA